METEVPALPDLMIEPVVRAALLEDLGRAGDITTDAIVPEAVRIRAEVVARQTGVVSGLSASRLAFRLLDPEAACEILVAEGGAVEPGTVVMRVAGRGRAILSAERVALNLLCRVSGIASATARLVEAVRPHPTAVTCTRKTTPGLRFLEKAAVRAGGGANHRFGLDDAVLIKDNHVAVAGGVGEAVRRAKAAVGHLVKVEVEVDRLDQIPEALSEGADAILLDNMTPDMLREAVTRIDGRAVTEASGRITEETAPAIAASGVDMLSAGWLTHSARALDLGLDMERVG